MTRENAILHMILRREELKHSVGDLDEDIKAFDMAIEALEQRPCEDAISRQAAIDAIENTKAAMATDGEIYVAKINAEMNIQQLPPVSVAENVGRWKECEDNTSFVRQIPRRWLECSNCGWSCDLGYKSRYKYCPNCGKKMIGPQESEAQDEDSN